MNSKTVLIEKLGDKYMVIEKKESITGNNIFLLNDLLAVLNHCGNYFGELSDSEFIAIIGSDKTFGVSLKNEAKDENNNTRRI